MCNGHIRVTAIIPIPTECGATRIVTLSDNNDHDHHIPEDIEGWNTSRRSRDEESRRCRSETRD